MPIPPLRDWRRGSNLYDSSHHQEPVEALRNLSSTVDALFGERDWAYKEDFLAVLVLNGPDDEADSADETYWFKKVYVERADDPLVDPITTDDDLIDAPEPESESESPVAPILKATNTAEISGHTHRLRVDETEIVHVFGWFDRDDPNEKRFLFTLAPYPVRVTPTAFVGGALGKYTGPLKDSPAAYIAATGGITTADFGSAADACIIVNSLEVGRAAGVHILDLSAEWPGQIVGSTDDGTPVVEIWAGPGPGEHFECKLTQTGGSNGNSTTAPSYTYTLKALNDETLGTVVAPNIRLWDKGTVTAATRGIAYYTAAGALVLSMAYEVRTTIPC